MKRKQSYMKGNLFKNKRFLVIDGSHYLYRSYYGVPSSAKLPSGLQVNAVYGFMAYVRKVVKAVQPSKILTVFDSETGIGDKVEEKDTYKSNRSYEDVGMYEQLPLIKKILDYLDIRYVEPSNYEADDYIGALAYSCAKDNLISYIFSNDADFFQIIGPNIYVVKMGRKSPEIIDRDVFQKEYTFPTSLYLDYLSLKGDSSDNVAGIRGIGHKTAQYLVKNFGTIENVFANLNLIDRKRVRNLLEKNKKLVESNKAFLKIKTDINIRKELIQDQSSISFHELEKSSNYLLEKIGVSTK